MAVCVNDRSDAMIVTMKKDPAAVALGKKRWKGKTEAEKLAWSVEMNEKRTEATTAEERIALAKKAAAARWGKKKAAKKGAKKA